MADPTGPQSPRSNDADRRASTAAASEPARPAPRLLELLVCPLTKATLELSRDRTELISRRARLAYPIRDGIPLLTSETARELTDDDLKTL
jgi:uncharacterized protein YbaR (Trm112 family)